MIKKLLSLFCLLVVCSTFAQQKAITERGEEVILFNDGTWKYENEELLPEKEISTNPIKFTKHKESTFLLKSKKFNVGFYLNPKIWSFSKASDNPSAEYEFQLKEGDLYGMVITEKVEIPLETLKSIAFENAKALAPDLHILKEEYRVVNGLKVLLLQMNGTLQGIKFSYYGYYYSSPEGTVQYVTYTAQNLLESYIPEIEKLLNGLIKI
jgi:hypothetical protein